MAVQVSTGAEVLCTFGAAPAVFAASSENVAATTPAGVITDVELENIATFGMCSAPTNPEVIAATSAALGVFTPAPCVPVLTPWTPGAAGVAINGVTAPAPAGAAAGPPRHPGRTWATYCAHSGSG